MMQVLKFDGLMIDGVDAMNTLADVATHFQLVRESIRAVPAAFSEGFSAEVPESLLVAAGAAGRIARHITVGAQVSWGWAVAHWAEYGAEYRSVAQFLAALWLLQARDALGDVPAEEFEALGECAELPAVQARGAAAVIRVRAWAWGWLVKGYEIWLDAVSREVVEILGYSPKWVQKSVLG